MSPRPLDPGEDLFLGGAEEFASKFLEVHGTAVRAGSENASAATLRVDMDLENAVIRAPTGTPGPRQTCREEMLVPVEFELEVEGATLHFEGVERAVPPAFELWLELASLKKTRGPWPYSDSVSPTLQLLPSGKAEGSIIDPETREPVLTLSFGL